jgi:hypothetical protein
MHNNVFIPWSSVFLEKLTLKWPRTSSLLWSPRIHYLFHKISSLAPLLNLFSPVNNFTLYFSKVYSKITIRLNSEKIFSL